MWSQAWHCSTWPPSAALRQCSIADMTLSWPRLRCPACAQRHAGPWARKISATSRSGRDMPEVLGGWSQRLQWTDDLAQDIGGHLGIEGGRLKPLVPEQHLDDADIHLLL